MDFEEKEAYYFTRRKKKHPNANGGRADRFVHEICDHVEETSAGPQGYWKMSNTMHEYRDCDGTPLGKKNLLNYFTSSHVKTEWKMHEFVLDQSQLPSHMNNLDEEVLCRIYKTTDHGKRKAETVKSSQGSQQNSTEPEKQPLKRLKQSSQQPCLVQDVKILTPMQPETQMQLKFRVEDVNNNIELLPQPDYQLLLQSQGHVTVQPQGGDSCTNLGTSPQSGNLLTDIKNMQPLIEAEGQPQQFGVVEDFNSLSTIQSQECLQQLRNDSIFHLDFSESLCRQQLSYQQMQLKFSVEDVNNNIELLPQTDDQLLLQAQGHVTVQPHGGDSCTSLGTSPQSGNLLTDIKNMQPLIEAEGQVPQLGLVEDFNSLPTIQSQECQQQLEDDSMFPLSFSESLSRQLLSYQNDMNFSDESLLIDHEFHYAKKLHDDTLRNCIV